MRIYMAALLATLLILLSAPLLAGAATGKLDEDLQADLADAIAPLEAELAKAPESANLRFSLALLYIRLGETRLTPSAPPTGQRVLNPAFQTAAMHLTKLLQSDPGNYLPRYYLGLIYIHEGRYDQASESLFDALSLKRNDYRIYAKLHSVLLALNKYKDSEGLMLLALRETGPSRETYHRIALSRYLDRNFRDAMDAAGRAQALGYETKTALLMAASALGLESYDRALKEYTEILARTPSEPAALAGMARVYEATGKTDMALKYARKALAADPDQKDMKELIKKLSPKQ